MSLLKSKKRESTRSAKPKTEKKELKEAYVIPAQIGQQMIAGLEQIPMKHAGIVGPMLDYLHNKAYRADLSLQVPIQEKANTPPVKKPTPTPSQVEQEGKDSKPKE